MVGGYGCSTPMERSRNLARQFNTQPIIKWNYRRRFAALAHLGPVAYATVYTDSRYVIDGLTKWLPSWRRRGWVTTTGSAGQKIAIYGSAWRNSPPRTFTGDTFAAIAVIQTTSGLTILHALLPAVPFRPCSMARLALQMTPYKTSRQRLQRNLLTKPSPPNELLPFPNHAISVLSKAMSPSDTNWPACEARVRGVLWSQI